MSTQVKQRTTTVNIVSINPQFEIPIQDEISIMPIPGSGLCWIVSFLIGLFLRLENDSELQVFADIIGGLPGILQKYRRWILHRQFLQKSLDWTKESFQDAPLYPLINSLKRAILNDSYSIQQATIADFGEDAIAEEGWTRDFEVNRTHYGSFFSVRVLQKFFTMKGLKTNLVIFSEDTSLFGNSGFKDCQSFDPECPTIATYFINGSHFDLLHTLPELIIDHCREALSLCPPPPPPCDTRAEEAQSSLDPLVEDLLRRLEEANRRIVHTERNAEQRIAEIERNAAQRVSEAEQRVSDLTSHTEQEIRVMEETLEQSLRSNDELRDEISKLRKNQSDADEALARLTENLG
jgi:hypothetical protein